MTSVSPLALGLLASGTARAQSMIPIRRSGPPRPPPSLPPREGQKRAKERSDESSKSESEDVSSRSEQTATLAPNEVSADDTSARTPESGSTGPESHGDYLHNPYLTTDWAGVRPWLQEHGIDLQAQYTAEGFTRLRGGTGSPHPYEYLGSSDLSMDVDTGMLGAWKGGSFNAHLKQLHGRGISAEHVGSIQSISNLEAPTFATLAEYWFRQEFFDGRLAFKMGKQDANTDFAASQFSGNLLEASFGAFPTLALPTYPSWALGIAAIVVPAPWLAVRLGAFDGAPDSAAPFGGTSVFDLDSPHLVIGEVQLRAESKSKGTAATLRLGAWHHSGDVVALPTYEGQADLATLSHNDGAYAVADVTLYRPSGESHQSEGLGVFVQAGHAAEDRNEVSTYLGGGLSYTGLLANRERDVLAAGVGHVELARRIRALESRTAETTFELTYKVQVFQFLSVQPSFQYVLRPSGRAVTPDATVAGVRVVTRL